MPPLGAGEDLPISTFLPSSAFAFQDWPLAVLASPDFSGVVAQPPSATAIRTANRDINERILRAFDFMIVHSNWLVQIIA